VASGAPTFINLFAILLLTPKFLELLKDFKARHLGVGKIDPNCRVFFENGRKEK
jgi:AGCS family alanine or glycine:cation symporter